MFPSPLVEDHFISDGAICQDGSVGYFEFPSPLVEDHFISQGLAFNTWTIPRMFPSPLVEDHFISEKKESKVIRMFKVSVPFSRGSFHINKGEIIMNELTEEFPSPLVEDHFISTR